MITINIQQIICADDGIFPNSELPVLHYKGGVTLSGNEDGAGVFEKIFESNDWSNSWRNGIYDYPHYHSTTHEVLGIYSGKAEVRLGGDQNGKNVILETGDVLIIPAGVAHCAIKSDNKFACVGAYPGGASYDINTGKPGERPSVDLQIKKVQFPKFDPIYGKEGPLLNYWKK